LFSALSKISDFDLRVSLSDDRPFGQTRSQWLGSSSLPDRRQHRGPHPGDHSLFSASQLPNLRLATRDLNWLLTKGYAQNAALKLVGDRYRLVARQRLAVARSACGDNELARRTEHEVTASDLRGNALWIDGYNVLTTIEAALAGGVILHGRDGCFRDMASMHGSYRRVNETIPAIELIGDALSELGFSSCRWLFDQPVSNSGRLKTIVGEIAGERNWTWEIELCPNPDKVLEASDQIVASADSQIMNKAARWFNLARRIIQHRLPSAWIADLSIE
jgi:hypothetical protein